MDALLEKQTAKATCSNAAAGSTRRSYAQRLFPSMLVFWGFFFRLPAYVHANNPSILFRDMGRASLAASAQSRLHRNMVVNTNSLLKTQLNQRGAFSRQVILSWPFAGFHPLRHRRMLVRRHVLDIFDPLEPFEMMWEFYCNRYEIMDELLVKLAAFTKRNSIKAMTIMTIAYGSAEILARLGLFGKRGEGLWDAIKDSERLNEGVGERALQKTSTWMLDQSMMVLKQFRHFGGKSKFAIAVSAGAFFGQGVIQFTTVLIRTALVTFFVLETASFLGMIGEEGESILQWIDTKRDESPEWMKTLARCHKETRKRMSFDWAESLYEAAVDEEKIAAFGFSVGTVVGLFT